MRIPRFVLQGLIITGLAASSWVIAKADYESSDYVMDGVGWRSIPADSESDNYAINGAASFGQAATDNPTYTLHAGATDTSVLPTPPAPEVSVVPTQMGTIHLTVKLGDNDPYVEVQVRLTDVNQAVHYFAPSGDEADESVWNSYTSWGSSVGIDISGLNAVGYVAQVRVRGEAFTISEWSAESAAVTPLSEVLATATTPPTTGISLPPSIENLITAIQKAVREGGLGDISKAIATALVPLTAIAALSQIATVGGFLFQIMFEIANRLFGALLSGLQFFAFYRKKRVFGIVYDGFTKRPLPGATVEVLRPDTRRLLDSQKTDEKGQYYFLDEANTSYLIRVSHPRFDTFEHIVRGRVNLPIYLGLKLEYDTVQLQKRSHRSALLEHMSSVRLWLLLIGTVAWGILFIGDYQGWVGFALGAYYVLAWSLELYVRRQPRPYGLVVNATSKAALALVVVRITNEEGKIIGTLVCDEQGRFKTWLKPGVYSFAFSKAGFNPAIINGAHINRSIKSMEVTAALQPA